MVVRELRLLRSQVLLQSQKKKKKNRHRQGRTPPYAFTNLPRTNTPVIYAAPNGTPLNIYAENSHGR